MIVIRCGWEGWWRLVFRRRCLHSISFRSAWARRYRKYSRDFLNSRFTALRKVDVDSMKHTVIVLFRIPFFSLLMCQLFFRGSQRDLDRLEVGNAIAQRNLREILQRLHTLRAVLTMLSVPVTVTCTPRPLFGGSSGSMDRRAIDIKCRHRSVWIFQPHRSITIVSGIAVRDASVRAALVTVSAILVLGGLKFPSS